MTDAVRPVGILLAAGRGARFGGDKLLAPLPRGGGRVGEAACARLVAVVPSVIAIVRPGDAAVAAMLAAAGAQVVVCPDADDGMGASLACGVRSSSQATGWIVTLADMPWVTLPTIAAVAAAVAAGALAAAPFFRGQRGHPVGFGAPCGAALAALSGDDGARSVLAARRDALVRIDVEDPDILRDIDTREDLA